MNSKSIINRKVKKLTATALGALVMSGGISCAEDKPADADNFYKSGKVASQKVEFNNQYKMKVAGNLFLPGDMDKDAKYPAIVVGHPMGAVKEQSANLYAAKMAERGFVTLAIDLPFWGESAGEPRNAVSPDMYAEAFSAAVDFLGTRPFVDRGRIGAIGICGSGSFAISAAKIDPRLKAVATVSMYDMGVATATGSGNRRLLNKGRRFSRKRRNSVMWNSLAGQPNTPAEQCMNSTKIPTPLKGNSMNSTALREANSPPAASRRN